MQQTTTDQKNTIGQWIFHPVLLPLLALSSWISFLLFFPTDMALVAGEAALPGEATLLGVDVSARVGLFYKSFFLTFGLAGLGLFVLRDWRDRESPEWLQLWQAAGAAALALLWCQLMGSPQPKTEFFLLSLCIGLGIYQAAQQFQKLPIEIVDFVSLAAIAIGLAFLLKAVNGQFLTIARPFPLSWLLSFTLLFGLRIILHRSRKVLLSYYTRLVLPLACIPVLLVLSQEVYFLANHYGLHGLTPNSCFLILIAIGLLSWIVLIEPRLAKKEWTQTEYLGKAIFPILLVGLVAFAQQAIFIKYPREIFELANGANGIMRWFHFGEWPIIEWLSSHLLYDIDVRSIYTAIYGYDGSLDFLAFDFIPKTLFALLGYFFLKSILKDPIFAFALALFFPFMYSLIPGTMAMGLCTFFILRSLLNNFTKRKVFYLASWLSFLILWKIEIGLSAIVGTLFVLFWYQLHEFDWKKIWSLAQLALAFVIGAAALFLLINTFSEVNLTSHFLQALDYFGADQAHAYADISKDRGLHFQYHYFIFPWLLGCVALFFLFQKRKAFKKSKQPYFAMAILFMIGYYIFNAQRGIVRHGLIEGTETFISSFAYLVIALIVFYSINNKRYAALAMAGSLLFMFHNYKHRSSAGHSNQFELMSKRFSEWKSIKHKQEKINRVWGGAKYEEEKYGDFKSFMDANFSSDATFIDFATNPMLYFYLQRPVPSYFNQYLQNTVTDFLQKENIEGLKNYDVPVVVFSHFPEHAWFDNIDGVPNTVRFATLAHHIYDQYEPHGIYNGYYIWSKKSLNLPKAASLDSAWVAQVEHYGLASAPLFANTTKSAESRQLLSWQGAKAEIAPIASSEPLWLHCQIASPPTAAQAKVEYFSEGKLLGDYTFALQPNQQSQNYTLPISSQYNWHQFAVDSIALSSGNDEVNFLNSALIVIADEH